MTAPAELAGIMLALGRILLGGLFVVGGIRHFFFITDLVLQMMTARGVPAPRIVLYAGSAFEIAAGLLLMSGFFVTPAALGLVVFTLIASVMLLNFWDMEGSARQSAITTWQSNLAIVGGLLIAAVQAL